MTTTTNFDWSEVVVTVGSNTITGFSTEPCKPKRKSPISIGSHSFPQYIAKRLHKDGLGFLPINHWKESATDCKTYIKAPIPEDNISFLAYLHELGHCKSKQPRQEAHGMFGMIGGWCNGRLQCEYNAWIWALRYFRRLGFAIDKECRDVITFALESYCNNAKDTGYAKSLANKFLTDTGIEVKVRDKIDFGSLKSGLEIIKSRPAGGMFTNDWTKTVTLDWYSIDESTPMKSLLKHHKPWHDLKNQQIKKAWRNQK